MDLDRWMELNVRHGKRARFAADLGVCVQTLSSIRTGAFRPSMDLALRISAATGGAVSVESIRGGQREDWPMNARIFEGDPVPDATAQDARRRATEDRLVLDVLVTEPEFGLEPDAARQCLADAEKAGMDVFMWAADRLERYRRTG